jgi:hypothetical protein
MSIRRMSVLIFLISSVAVAAPAVAYAATANSDATTAKALNLTRAYLPASVKWTATAQAPNTAAETALGVKAVRCIRQGGGAAGKISTDPFGTTEVVGGSVTADVESPDFAVTGSSGLPLVSSEVVMLTSAAQATDDLSAFATSSARTCLTNVFVAIGKQGGYTKVAATAPSIPQLGSGPGGLDLRFVFSGGKLSPLIDYTYFYVQGRAEFDLSFIALGTQFPAAWANAIAAHVMDKARSVLG